MSLKVIWPGGVDPEQEEFDRRIADARATLPIPSTPQEARQLREDGISIFPVRPPSDRAHNRSIATPDGPMEIRVIEPTGEPTGVYLHLHGGGWMIGRPHHMDHLNVRLADATGMVVVSPYYRLAPEDPYPAGPDDALTAARWVLEESPAEWGTSTFSIGGESAGAHLSASTLIRLRDEDGAAHFSAAHLAYGAFDLSGTPSAKTFGDPPVTFSQPALEWMTGHFIGDGDPTDPAISPLYSDLKGLSPAVFTVGTNDPLLDDSLFMATRWAAGGNETLLIVQPGGHHAFDYFDDAPGQQIRLRVHEFLRAHLG